MTQKLSIQSQYQEQARRQTTRSAQPIEPVPLGASATDIYVTNGADDFWVTHLIAANVTGSTASYTLYFVEEGGAAGTANTVVFQKSLAGNTSEIIDVAVNHRIPAGAKIQALCSSANAINVAGWGYDQGSEE